MAESTRHCIIIPLIGIICIVFALPSFSQSESFKLGKQAYNQGKYNHALKNLKIAVEDEKFLMKGKEIPLAYAYMSIMKNKIIESKLNDNNFDYVLSYPDMFGSSVSDLSNAIKFNGNSITGQVSEAQSIVFSNTAKLCDIISKKMLATDIENMDKQSKALASFINTEFNSYSKVDDNWQVYDLLGLSNYILGQQEEAIQYFDKAREFYLTSNSDVVSEIHLYNYIYSTRYYYNEKKNYIESDVITLGAIDYIHKLAHLPENNSIEKIKELSSIESIFSNIRSQLNSKNNTVSTQR